MRIDLNTATANGLDGASTKSLPGASSAPSIAAGGALTEATHVSPDVGKIQLLVQRVLNLPEIRQERVAALSQQIGNGSYPSSPQQTAESLFVALGPRTA